MLDKGYIDNWIRHVDASADVEEPDSHWIDNYLIGLMLTNRAEELWEFITAAYRRDVSEHVLSVIAAGPLEDLLVISGHEFIDRVESLASQDPVFRRMLNGVWRNAMPEDLWSRVCALKDEDEPS